MLTLEEIENISFRRSGFGGYRTDDVDDFVDSVIEKIRDLELANKEQQVRIDQLNHQLLSHEEKADSVQDAIIAAEITAKTLVRDATIKAESILADANTQAGTILSEAQEKADSTLIESNAKSDIILNHALELSAKSVEENNSIIEQQKEYITRLQDEVAKFKGALIDTYRSHLKLINSLPDEEDLSQYREDMDKAFPAARPVTAQDVEHKLDEEVRKVVNQRRKTSPDISVEIDTDRVREISREQAQATGFDSGLLTGKGDSFVETISNGSESIDADSNNPGIISDHVTEKVPEAEQINYIRDCQEPVIRLVSDGTSIKGGAEDGTVDLKEMFGRDNSEIVEDIIPQSIDEVDDGVIFSSSKAEKRFKAAKKNNAQSIGQDD